MQGKALTALLIAVASLSLLVGCGGGGEEEQSSSSPPAAGSSASTTSQSALPEEVQAKLRKTEQRVLEERRQAEHDEKQSQAAQPPKVGHHDSGGGSAQFRHAEGDNSIPEYGEEADSSDREAAADSLHAYLDSVVAQRWQAACSYLSASLLASLKRLPELLKRKSDFEGKGCAEILETLNGGTPQGAVQAAAKADVASLRIEGERALLLYRGAGGEAYAMPMVREEGVWRVGSLGGTPGI